MGRLSRLQRVALEDPDEIEILRRPLHEAHHRERAAADRDDPVRVTSICEELAERLKRGLEVAAVVHLENINRSIRENKMLVLRFLCTRSGRGSSKLGAGKQ